MFLQRCSQALNGRRWIGLFHFILNLIALQALLLPVYGPIFDHHFGERQLYHIHLYTEAGSFAHVHLYEAPHTHGHEHGRAQAPFALGFSDDLLSDGVVSLPANDLIHHQFSSIELTLTEAAALRKEGSQDERGSLIQESLLLARSITILPPRKPPRS